MGQIIDKLMEPLATRLDNQNSQPTIKEDSDNVETLSPKTPPNIIRLKTDPRSPLLDTNRTPIKVPLDD